MHLSEAFSQLLRKISSLIVCTSTLSNKTQWERQKMAAESEKESEERQRRRGDK